MITVQHKPSPTQRKNLLNLTLRGLPELDHFPTPNDRQAALDAIANESGNLGAGGFWMNVVVVVGGALLGRWLFGWLLSFVLWPRFLEEIIHTIGMLGSFFVILRWLHRRGTAVELRRKLLAHGVPVCVECGYLLRGLTADMGRCPECGKPFSPEAAEILHRQGTP